ncbi:MAG TPA: DUF4347 domain-containing protein [Hyphomicrobiales bacterium]|jgi:hypothetical protein
MQLISSSESAGPGGFRSPQPDAYVACRTRLTFIDSHIECPSLLIPAARSGADLVFLSRNRDGIEQIVRHLRGRGRLSSIHLLAEVARGRLLLCGRALGLRELREREPDISRIGRSLAGCGRLHVGAGRIPDGQGERLLQALAEFAGVPVAGWSGSALTG